MLCDELVSEMILGSVECLGRGDVLCLYARLRLALEAAIQRAFYRLMGIEWGEALKRISHRSRFAASFTASMIKNLRGVHGVRKRWILRTYLRLGTWLHPSVEMRRCGGRPPLDEELVVDVLDAITYLCSYAAGGVPKNLAEVSELCTLRNTAKLLRKVSPEGGMFNKNK